MAEREGFEPSVRVTTYAGLASRCLQPLGHRSFGRGDLTDVLESFKPIVIKERSRVLHPQPQVEDWPSG